MEFKLFDLGLIDFARAWEFQKKIFLEVKSGTLVGGLILCRHYPVVTLGRQGKAENILASSAELSKNNIKVYKIERGGDVTYHGPGQLTIYPVFNLNYLKKDIHWFLRKLEELTVDFLSDFGLCARTHPGLTGVWIGEKKIASIGIAIKNWITFHGLSINIKEEDLQNFRMIRPCGMDIEMTSLESELGREIEFAGIKENIIAKFGDLFSPAQEGVKL